MDLPQELAAAGASNYTIEVTVTAMLYSENAFQLCLEALQTDNNQQWYWAWVLSLQSQSALEELHELTGNSDAAAAADFSEQAAINALDAFLESGASLPGNRNTRRGSGR